MGTSAARSPQDILRKPYARILTPTEDGTYTAEILEFHGCYAEGETADEAIKNLEAAAESWIEASLAVGQEIPAPADVYEFSGRINLRLPRSIHKQAARFAERDDVSLNQFFTAAIASRVGAEDLYERMAERLQYMCMPAVQIVKVEASFNSFELLSPFPITEPKLQDVAGDIDWNLLASKNTKALTDA